MITALKSATCIGYVCAWNVATNWMSVGLVMDDGRCRVDYHGDLSDLTFWDVTWRDEKNPWLGHSRVIKQRHDLRSDYT